jgi:hypothetical protein
VVAFTKYNNLGEPFAVYREEPLVPRIDDRFLDCSIYLYPKEERAGRGESAGGSGFLAAIPGFGPGWMLGGKCPQEDFYHSYAVSNAHVAEKHPVVRLNRDDSSTANGHFTIFPFTRDDWTFSDEYDIAVAPIDYKEGHRYLFIPEERFLTPEIAARHDVGIGDEVFMIGRFINHEGRQRNNPSVRWGHVAMMPVEVPDDVDQPKKIEKDFVVETHSIAGYSGSPVIVRPLPAHKLLSHVSDYLYVPVVEANTNVLLSGSTPGSPVHPVAARFGGPWLLGIERAFIHYKTEQSIKANTGMSAVVPAWHILDLLNTDKLKMQRRAEQERLLKSIEREGTTLTE